MTRSRRTVVVAVAVAALVTAANASQGAYFSQSWGWVALAFLMPATVALILGVSEVPGRLRIAFAVLMGALGVWIALSSTWSLSPAGSMREVERMLVYVALALAVALVLRRGDATGVAAGSFIGATGIGVYALATRLFQDVFDTYDAPFLPYRLSDPVGYWNSLGLLMAMGLILALGVTAHARRSHFAAAAALSMPSLVCALYFTFSRGAWGALAVGSVVMVAADARRLRLLWVFVAVAPASIVAVAVASQQSALTTEDAPARAAVVEGNRLAAWLVALSALSGVLALAAHFVAQRVPTRRVVRRSVDGALTLAAFAVVAYWLAALGGPSSAYSELRDRFEAGISVDDPNDLNERLFSFSANGRVEHIQVAWDAARERPVVGNGAGTYEYFWYQLRPLVFDVRDAHSLYAEVLGEVGGIGLALLALALVLPVAAAARARRSRVAPMAFGVFVAWAVHASLDWHWEVVGVTVTALLAGSACLLAAERRRGDPLPEPARLGLAGALVALSLFAVVSLVGNQALFAGREAVRNDDWAAALDHARRAEALLPWSFEPAIVRGDARAGLGDGPGSLAAYRAATERDPENWVAWLRRAQVARGSERASAYARVRELNPLEPELPGDPRRVEP